MTATPRVLLLEDQMMIAFGIKAALEKHGFEVVGPYADLKSAENGAEETPFDVAVLDINLGDGTTSEGFAQHLLERNVPFMFLSGYGSAGQLHPRFSEVIRMTKPIAEAELIEGINDLAARGRG
ncbi:response regulator [Yoonia sp. R2331]|uniref:response regulator n=1 Tax=Yoonia sp. R2331 TaxID=3237238 RepID=UPI0034E56898